MTYQRPRKNGAYKHHFYFLFLQNVVRIALQISVEEYCYQSRIHLTQVCGLQETGTSQHNTLQHKVVHLHQLHSLE